MKFENMIAAGMLDVLNSKEHAGLFKKAYKEESSASSASKKDSDHAWAKDNAHKCTSCKEDMDHCMCGDMGMVKDNPYEVNDAKDGHKCTSCKEDMDHCMCGDMGMVDDNEVSDHSSASSMSSKHTMALNMALESLLKASAALDYCGLGKGSELAVKVATLVSQAKKGKVDLTGKREESAKKHLRKLRELAEEESSLPKGRGESKSSSKSDKKSGSKKKVSKASLYDEEKKFHSVKSRVSKLDYDDLTKLRKAMDGQSADLDNHLSLLLSDLEDLDKENLNRLLRMMGGYAHAAKNKKKVSKAGYNFHSAEKLCNYIAKKVSDFFEKFTSTSEENFYEEYDLLLTFCAHVLADHIHLFDKEKNRTIEAIQDALRNANIDHVDTDSVAHDIVNKTIRSNPLMKWN